MATAVKSAGAQKAPAKPRPSRATGNSNNASDKPKGEARPGPDFTVRGVGTELPPEPVNRRGGGRHAQLLENLASIQTEPGQWFEVVHYAARNGSEAKPSGARKIVGLIMDGQITMPEGDGGYDVEWRTANYDGSDRKGSVVVAMYSLEDTTEGATEVA